MRRHWEHAHLDHSRGNQGCQHQIAGVAGIPKPGLVGRWNSGAHQNMDFFTFLDSAAVLAPWFRKPCLLGARSPDLEDSALFPAAQSLGRQAEEAMLTATGGVNTHQGLIFSLGLLCTASGQLHPRRLPSGEEGPLETADLCRRAAALGCGSGLLHACSWRANARHLAWGNPGRGTPCLSSVRRWVLPVLQQAESPEEGGCQALLALIAHVEDANILRRGGHSALEAAAQRAKQVLNAPTKAFQEELTAFDQELIRAELSPGGCAGLLAVGYFLSCK